MTPERREGATVGDPRLIDDERIRKLDLDGIGLGTVPPHIVELCVRKLINDRAARREEADRLRALIAQALKATESLSNILMDQNDTKGMRECDELAAALRAELSTAPLGNGEGTS